MTLLELIRDELGLTGTKKSCNELLRQLAASYGSRFREIFFDPETEEIKTFYRILLGGREISKFKEGMNTLLEDNDVISITLIPYGGG